MKEPCPYEEKIVETHTAMFGGANPKEGLVWKIEQNTKTIQEFLNIKLWCQRHFWKLAGVLILWMGSNFGTFIIAILKDHVSIK